MTKNSEERSLGAYLAERRGSVEAALERFLPEASARPSRLHEAMRYSVFGGGKRLRPILAVAAYELSGGEGDAVLAPAAATELIHTYSLIHDDLPAMDDDDMRRGRPSCHRAFDEATAVLAGDALLTLAFEIVAREDRISAESRLSIVSELAAANGASGMVGGQVADMEGEGAEATLEAVEFIHINKTARPLRAAVRVGALAAGAAPDDLAALAAYGQAMGVAFQIADDLLDVTGYGGGDGQGRRQGRGPGEADVPFGGGRFGRRGQGGRADGRGAGRAEPLRRPGVGPRGDSTLRGRETELKGTRDAGRPGPRTGDREEGQGRALGRILDRIDSPADIKRLDAAALTDARGRARSEIIRVVSRNGGHLAPSLGVVELTLALHYVFDSPERQDRSGTWATRATPTSS